MGEKEKKQIFFSTDGHFHVFPSEPIPEVDMSMTEECVLGIDMAAGKDMTIEFKCSFKGRMIRHLIFGKYGKNNWRKMHSIPLIRKGR